MGNLTEILELLLGALFIALGAAALAFSLAGWRGRQRVLVSLGVFTALYGSRLMADSQGLRLLLPGATFWPYVDAFITYVILVPAAAFGEELAGGHPTLRRVRQLTIALAVVCIAGDLAAREAERMIWLNRAAILMAIGPQLLLAWRQRRRWAGVEHLRAAAIGAGTFLALAVYETFVSSVLIPETIDLEPFGMLAFISGLGYFVARRTIANEARLAAVSQELATARQIQASILPRELPRMPGVRIAARYVPMTEVAGDFYDVLPIDGARVGVLVADVSGHGVPAALVASMVKVAAEAQSVHAAEPARVLQGLNTVLGGKLERTFVTAVYAVVDAAAGRVEYAAAGHPPPLLRRASGEIEDLDERGIMLGPFPAATYTTASVPLRPGDRLILYTDGIPEAANGAAEFFGDAEFRRAVRAMDDDVDAAADALLARVRAWSGAEPGDDLTLVVIDLVAVAEPV